jgi:hypothetical protein
VRNSAGGGIGCGLVVTVLKNALRAFSNESSGIRFPHFSFLIASS